MYHLGFNQCCEFGSTKSVTGLGSRHLLNLYWDPGFLCAIISKTCWISFKDIHRGLTSKSTKYLIYFYFANLDQNPLTKKGTRTPDPDPQNLLQHLQICYLAFFQKFNITSSMCLVFWPALYSNIMFDFQKIHFLCLIFLLFHKGGYLFSSFFCSGDIVSRFCGNDRDFAVGCGTSSTGLKQCICDVVG